MRPSRVVAMLCPLVLLSAALTALADHARLGVTVRADLGRIEAPVSQVSDRVLSVQGEPQDLFGDPVERDFLSTIAPTFEVSLLGDPGGLGIAVRRDAAGQVVIEYDDFDAHLREIGALTGKKPRMLAVSTMPTALSNGSGKLAYAYNPRDWPEWRKVVREVVLHLRDVLGFRQIHLNLFSEPMTRENYMGYAGEEDRFPAFMDLVVNTIEAAHSAEPSVRFELTGVGDYTYSDEIWSLDHFLATLKERLPGIEDQGTLIAAWQGYHWELSEDLRRGVAHVQQQLVDAGFPADTPQALHGYGKWPFASSGTMTEESAASYFAANAFHFSRSDVAVYADYYTMYLVTPNPRGEFYRDSLYEVPHEVVEYLGFYAPESHVYRKNLPYGVMQILGDLSGDIMSSSVTGDPSGGVSELVARNRDVAQVAVANNDDEAADVVIELVNSPYVPGTLFDADIQRVDADHSNDGKGLERPVRLGQFTAEGEVVVLPPIRMPARSVALVTLRKAR